jgi:Phage integrase, N-terminal SAM-like domain
MMKHCPENERIKRAHLRRLSVRLSPASVDVAANAIHRFEQWTGCRPFKLFHIEQAIAFQQRLADTVSTRGGKLLSKATIAQTSNAMRIFFEWLRPTRLSQPHQAHGRRLFSAIGQGLANR